MFIFIYCIYDMMHLVLIKCQVRDNVQPAGCYHRINSESVLRICREVEGLISHIGGSYIEFMSKFLDIKNGFKIFHYLIGF